MSGPSSLIAALRAQRKASTRVVTELIDRSREDLLLTLWEDAGQPTLYYTQRHPERIFSMSDAKVKSHSEIVSRFLFLMKTWPSVLTACILDPNLNTLKNLKLERIK